MFLIAELFSLGNEYLYVGFQVSIPDLNSGPRAAQDPRLQAEVCSLGPPAFLMPFVPFCFCQSG